MHARKIFWIASAVAFSFCISRPSWADTQKFASHPPMRALPTASKRPLAGGPAYYVDVKGNDQHDGCKEKPWKTLGHASKQLKPGDTLYLRSGTYYESVTIAVRGTAEKPITIRSYPGELAILDAGFREFVEDPAGAWEKVAGGHPDEFRSTKTYTHGGGFGNFADSMVPLHRYIDFYDLRSTNEFYRESLGNRNTDPVGIYTGPGVRRDPETGRIHVRLSHTHLDGLGDRAYRGETDPRRAPLVVAGHDHTLTAEGAKHLRFEDLVFRGAGRSAILVTRDAEDISQDAEDIILDGCSLYGSGSALRVNHSRGLRVTNCAVRGHTAPWHSRFSAKNRAHAGYLVVIEGTEFELDHSEFTDHHDFLQFERADRLSLHHCLIDNIDDDGIEPGPKKARGTALIYQNVMMRTLNPFTAHADKPNQVTAEPGSGLYVFRNIIDLRQGTYKSPPAETDSTGGYLDHPTTMICHNHGSPTCAVYYVYQNTFLMPDAGFRGYGYLSWASHMQGTTRRVFNNLFVQVAGPPGMNFSALTADGDYEANGNLLWSVTDGPSVKGDVFAKFRSSPLFALSKKRYAPGWGAHDLFADPKFVRLENDARQPADLRLQSGSAAIDAGVALPVEWPDTLRDDEQGKPDLGALPQGTMMLRVGVTAN
jgi:hypothetical protein